MIRPALALMLSAAPLAAQTPDDTSRIAVMSAFEPEWISLQADLEGAETQTINGTEFITGTLSGQEVVLFLSGVSMVNAAMTTQMALERFDIEAIVFSGIAGGVDPALNIGDVVVADQWGQWLETVMARRTEDASPCRGSWTRPFRITT
ncbi:5'-methylthioadenosine/S-adenosylhomocysteine nucleosidase [Paracoccus sp. PAMC 22219]|uniref:5'-methylthioadenosine/S-adenosylhomocysteine nucleosidase n=1 Tax=Paracoccus sp. PAMC 22219 TaxID=1569209 RepID=UPI000A5BD107|nr:5'-methylthioadenosine/S-adenosylhomocysteine nucleosidase [Paracoccus sp. PAMC 22219]